MLQVCFYEALGKKELFFFLANSSLAQFHMSHGEFSIITSGILVKVSYICTRKKKCLDDHKPAIFQLSYYIKDQSCKLT